MKNKTYSFVGAALIIISTFVTGVLTFSLELEVSDSNTKISDLKASIEKADSGYQYALISDELASIRRTVVRVGVYQTKDVQKPYEIAYVASVYSNIQSLLSASGRGADIIGKYGSDLKELRDEIIKGLKPISKFEEILISLIHESAKYRGNLGIKIAKLESEKKDAELQISLWRMFAIMLQLIGLVVILFNDVPTREKITEEQTSTDE